MYKEAQAAPLPSPIGGIIDECGSRTHDYPSARPPPPPLQWVVKFFFNKDFLLIIININLLECLHCLHSFMSE